MGGSVSKNAPVKKETKKPTAPPRPPRPPLAWANAKSSEAKARAAFEAMDGNGDGILQPEEVCTYLGGQGYGADEAARFLRYADVNGDAVVDFGEFHAAWGYINAYRIAKHTEGTCLRTAVDGVDMVVEDCKGCTVLILDMTSQVQIDACTDVTFVLGPCQGSVFARDCERCEFYIACQQLRTRNCVDSHFHLYASTEPIIETSKGLRISPFNAAYDGLASQFQRAGFDPAANLFWAVYDFSSPDAQDEAHWREVAVEPTFNALKETTEPCPVPPGARAPVPEATTSIRGTAMHVPPAPS